MILALAGGVGGAKLAAGLAAILPANELVIVVNTGDDFVHLGLHISPDLDTMTYTLAGIADPRSGWGIANETWNFMEAVRQLGEETWFRLGDRDLATHVYRTRRLAEGDRLSEIAADIGRHLGVQHLIAPMSDDPVRTLCVSGDQRIAFQDYFVRQQCKPALSGFIYQGAESARSSATFSRALTDSRLEGVIICPSNPYLSIGPILAVAGVKEQLANRSCPVIAVSPLIAGDAIKGPAAKIMKELGHEASPAGIARYYEGLIDMLVIDTVDADKTQGVLHYGIESMATSILMQTQVDRERLAAACVSLIRK